MKKLFHLWRTEDRGGKEQSFSCKGPCLAWRARLEACAVPATGHAEGALPRSAWAACWLTALWGAGWAGAPTQSGAAGWTCFRRMWCNLDTTLDGREAFVFSTDCIPRIDNKHRHTIRFDTKSAQMKSKARTILNCLCFKTLSGRMPHFHMKNMFLFAVVSSPSFSFQGTA